MHLEKLLLVSLIKFLACLIKMLRLAVTVKTIPSNNPLLLDWVVHPTLKILLFKKLRIKKKIQALQVCQNPKFC
jgi:hypothetical protein